MSARDTRRGRGQARARMLTVHGATQRLKAGGLRGFLGLHKLVFLKNIYIYKNFITNMYTREGFTSPELEFQSL